MNKEYKVDVIPRSTSGMKTACPSRVFVKVTHIGSNISVTGQGRNNIEARDKASKNLDDLVGLWKNS